MRAGIASSSENIAFRARSPAGSWAATSPARASAAASAAAAGRRAVQEADRRGLLHADDPPGEDEVLGPGEPDQRHEPRRADGRAHPGPGPHELEVVAAHAQVAARGDLRARADDVADADGDAGHPDGVEGGVDPREGLHPRHRRRAVELLGHVGARAERPDVGRREHERPQAVVAGQVGERRLELGQLRRPERVARLRPVEPQHLDPVVAPLARQAAHGRASSRICGVKRLTIVLPAVLVTFLLLAPAALAHDAGEGTYGPADDKVVTNAGFILIAFFPAFIFTMSMLQWALDKRKERRKAAHRKIDFNGGW